MPEMALARDQQPVQRLATYALLEAAASEVVTRGISLRIARSGGLASAAEFLAAAASGSAGGAQVLLPAE